MFGLVLNVSGKVAKWLEKKVADGMARRIVARLEKRQLYPFSAKCLTGASVIMLGLVLVLLVIIIWELHMLR